MNDQSRVVPDAESTRQTVPPNAQPVPGSKEGTSGTSRPLGRRIAQGVAYTLLGAGLAKALTGLTSIVLARILGVSAFGQYGIVQSTVLMFSTYGSLRMGTIAIKYVAQYREDDPARAARILQMALWISGIACALASLGVAALAPQLAASTLARPELADALRVGSLFLFFITFGSIVQQALGGFEDFKATSLNGVLRAALSMAFAIPLAWVWGLYGALWGMALASLFTIPQAFLFLWRQQRRFKFPRHITLKEAFSEYPILYHFALPGFLMLAVMTGANWLGRVFLLRERGFADVGLFEAAGQWVMVVSFAPTVLSRVVLPILSSTASDNARESYQRTLSLQLQTVLLLTGPATILMIALCHWVTAVYGQEYAGTDKLMPVLFFTAFLRTVTETFRISYESKGRQWSGLTVYIVWALVFLGSAAFLTREWGAMGFALAGLAGQTALLAISAWQVHFQLVPGFLRLDGKLLVLMSAAIALSCVAWHALPLRAGVPACLALCVLTLIPLGTRLARANRRHNPIAILKNFLLRMPLLARWRTP